MKITTEDGVIQVNSGKYISFTDPNVADFDIHDIAHALSNTGRFGGHADKFYSVAQHCVLGSYKASSDSVAFEFMLHDASEAYLMDVPSPLKHELPAYGMLEVMWEKKLSQYYGVRYPFCREIHRLDLEALATEKRDLLNNNDEDWSILEGIDQWSERIHTWHPCYAKYRYLKRMKELDMIEVVDVPSKFVPILAQIFQRTLNFFS